MVQVIPVGDGWGGGESTGHKLMVTLWLALGLLGPEGPTC